MYPLDFRKMAQRVQITNYFFEFILRQILREYLEAYPFTVAALSRVVLAPKGENKTQRHSPA